MASTRADKMSTGNDIEGPETTIEIKIKTLDSQTYSLRVDKQMPVPALKDQIASVTGVLSDQQRLICRGKVLKDDQLLSAYHVEDGHTLHLVVRQPPVSNDLPDHPASDPASSTSGRQVRQVAPNVVIETFNLPDQADGVPPEINRIVSAVLGSFGIPNIGSSGEGVEVRDHGLHRVERTFGQPDRSHSAFGLSTPVSLGSLQPPVIPDSLTTLSQYQSHLSREFDAIARGGGNNTQATNTSPQSGTVQGLPTPASLAAVISSTRQMLVEQAGECLHQLARQLENQANVTDPSQRSSIQSNAWRSGVLFHNLGAFLLELGRATMTLRLGQSASEAVVNAGPAVFISPSGPSPLMVQPFPFQPGASFGAIPMGTIQPPSGLVNGIGLPRRFDIQIRRGSSTAAANADSQQPPGQTNPETNSAENVVNQPPTGAPEGPSFTGEQGVRIVPIRTVVAAVPSSFNHGHSEPSGSSMGLYYPVLGRVQHVGSGNVSGEHQPISIQTEQHIISEYTVQQNIEVPARDGSLPTLGPQDPSRGQNLNINFISAGGTNDNQETGGQVPSRVMHFLRTSFPGGEDQVGDAISHGGATDSVVQHVETLQASVNTPEVEQRASDEGIFISNMLCQIMPSISQLAGSVSNDVAIEEANTSEQRTARDSSTEAQNSDIGTSRRQSDHDSSAPNSKRQKTE